MHDHACHFHPTAPAVALCKECGAAICQGCRRQDAALDDYCLRCFARIPAGGTATVTSASAAAPATPEPGSAAADRAYDFFSLIKGMIAHPNETLPVVIAGAPSGAMYFIAAAEGFNQVLDKAVDKNLGDRMSTWTILAIAGVAGGIFGALGLEFGSYITRWSARRLGGSEAVTAKQIARIVAFGAVPTTAFQLAIYWPAVLALSGGEVFRKDPDLSVEAAFVWIILGFASLGLGIWSAILIVRGLKKLFGFSTLRTIGVLLLPGLMIMAVAIVGIILALGLPLFLRHGHA